MKKILFIAAMFLVTSSVFAQKITGGLFIGPELSWLGVDSKIQSSEKIGGGYEFGAWGDFNIHENFLFNMELKFKSMSGTMGYKHGAIVDLYDSDTTVYLPYADKDDSNIKYTLNYLSIPLSIKGKTNEINLFSYYMKAGIAPMFNIKSKATIYDESNLFTKNVLPVNLNWHMGGGIEFRVADQTRIVAELMYSGGIFSFIKNNKNDIAVDVYEMNSFAVKFGILF